MSKDGTADVPDRRELFPFWKQLADVAFLALLALQGAITAVAIASNRECATMRDSVLPYRYR